jgi:tetratricopeptide (TPR) repeat protein
LDIEVSHRGYWVLSQIYLARNEPAQAVAVLQKAVALGGSQVSDSLTRLAQAHRAAGDIDLALQALSDAKALSPTNEWTWRVEGVLLRQLARYEESAAAFSKAQSLRSTSMAFQGLGDTLLRLKRFPEAEQALRKAVQLSAACSACSASLAKALASQNREPEALAALEAALGKEPGPFADYYSLADVYKRLGKPEQGAAFLREALRKYPDSYNARAALNTLLHDSMFDFEGAYQGNRQLFDKNPNSDAVKANLAEAAFTAGRNDEALQLAGQVLSAERGDPQRRLAMRIITVAASLARNEPGQAFSELGKFVDDYREVPRDWDRTWRFDGLRRCLQTSAALNAPAKEILTRMVEALETNRPASDEAVKRIESLLTSDTFLKLRR